MRDRMSCNPPEVWDRARERAAFPRSRRHYPGSDDQPHPLFSGHYQNDSLFDNDDKGGSSLTIWRASRRARDRRITPVPNKATVRGACSSAEQSQPPGQGRRSRRRNPTEPDRGLCAEQSHRDILRSRRRPKPIAGSRVIAPSKANGRDRAYRADRSQFPGSGSPRRAKPMFGLEFVAPNKANHVGRQRCRTGRSRRATAAEG
jgi:hypothetical protein